MGPSPFLKSPLVIPRNLQPVHPSGIKDLECRQKHTPKEGCIWRRAHWASSPPRFTPLFILANDRWSAAWESCLWSRLRDPRSAWFALRKVFHRYTSPNLLGLHPALVSSEPSCRTCFQDSGKEFVEQSRDPSDAKRGLVNRDGAVVRSSLSSYHSLSLVSNRLQLRVVRSGVRNDSSISSLWRDLPPPFAASRALRIRFVSPLFLSLVGDSMKS